MCFISQARPVFIFLIIFNRVNAISHKYVELKQLKIFLAQDVKFGTHSAAKFQNSEYSVLFFSSKICFSFIFVGDQ